MSTVKNRRVMVTGGAGMIGSCLVKKLVALGVDVHVADNLWRGSLENLEVDGEPVIDLERRFHHVDLSHASACEGLFDEFDTVYHLADVVAGINYVFGNQFSLFTTNLAIDRNVLTACVRAKVPNYLYVGSACSYPKEKQGGENPPPLREDEAYPASPESAYGWSKLMGEHMAELAQREGLLNVAILRLHNVYGPCSELSPERSQVIPSLIRKAIRYPLEPFVVWGSGRQRRAFVYVDDVAEALLRARERAMNAGVIQFGSPSSVSIAEIAERVVAISGREIPIVFDRSKPEGDFDRYPCLDRARDILGLLPKTSIGDGLAATMEWARGRLGAERAARVMS
jgi:nucleoside-diphosphate-sugar epimerase